MPNNFLKLNAHGGAKTLSIQPSRIAGILKFHIGAFKTIVSDFSIPTNKQIDKKLIIGSVFFGSGWGLIGLCPGPAIASIALLNMSSAIFVVSMFTGFYISAKVN